MDADKWKKAVAGNIEYGFGYVCFHCWLPEGVYIYAGTKRPAGKRCKFNRFLLVNLVA